MEELQKDIKSPKYAKKFLLWFLKKELAEEVLGDLEEKFYENLGNSTLRKVLAQKIC